jgi:AcrR family transcriptional regulator
MTRLRKTFATVALAPAPGAASALPGADVPRPAGVRSDGEASRERLLRAGLHLFARQGYAATSTRELAQAAGMNVAAIAYYFGDKAGLYRAVFFEPLDEPGHDPAAFADPALGLQAALTRYYQTLLAPLDQGEDTRLCVKLRMREMLEPTGLWQEELDHGIRPLHQALCAVLCRQLGLAAPDDEVQRLAVCLFGLSVHLHVGREVIDAVAPGLNAGADATRRWADCLLRQALAMVDHEQRRRAAGAADRPAPA